MAGDYQGRKVAILAADGVERVELEQPRQAIEGAGGTVTLLSIHDGEIAARNNDLEDAGTFRVDAEVSNADIGDFDALLLPGGTVNPDKLRMDDRAVGFVRDFYQSGKPIATICHGPWTLAEADVIDGLRITSFPSIRTDLSRAGGKVVDEEVVVDRGVIPSRSPQDLKAFCAKIVEEFASGGTSERSVLSAGAKN